jgi:hypothetical protein
MATSALLTLLPFFMAGAALLASTNFLRACALC